MAYKNLEIIRDDAYYKEADAEEKRLKEEKEQKQIEEERTMTQKLRILHIHVRGEYWEQASQGIKDEEYREIKPYWTKMLSKDYDLIYYYYGYSSKKRIFRWDGYVKKIIKHKEFGNKPKPVYAISLRLAV